jgi:hypothetical protein
MIERFAGKVEPAGPAPLVAKLSVERPVRFHSNLADFAGPRGQEQVRRAAGWPVAGARPHPSALAFKGPVKVNRLGFWEPGGAFARDPSLRLPADCWVETRLSVHHGTATIAAVDQSGGMTNYSHRLGAGQNEHHFYLHIPQCAQFKEVQLRTDGFSGEASAELRQLILWFAE